VLIHVELQEADLSDLAAGREPLLKYISDQVAISQPCLF
jgi:hypothetical protein